MSEQLGPPPSNPELIGFARECFVEDGENVEFVVVMAAPRYPERFASRAAAERFAARCGRVVVEERSPRRRRVRWF